MAFLTPAEATAHGLGRMGDLADAIGSIVGLGAQVFLAERQNYQRAKAAENAAERQQELAQLQATLRQQEMDRSMAAAREQQTLTAPPRPPFASIGLPGGWLLALAAAGVGAFFFLRRK